LSRLALLLLVVAVAAPAAADGGHLKLRRLRSHGPEVTYAVVVQDARDLYAFQAGVRVRGEAYRISQVSEGGFLGADGTRTLFVQKEDPAHPGRWLISGSRLGKVAGVAGKGRLATITLSPVGDRARRRHARLRLVRGETLLVSSTGETIGRTKRR